jgi:hypothetical protein
VIKPVELTEATVELELDHVTSDAGELPPEPFAMLADACTEVPDAMEAVGRVITRDELGSDVEPPPPHAARASENPARIPETHRIGRVSPDAVPGRLRCEVSGSTLHYTEAGASLAGGERVVLAFSVSEEAKFVAVAESEHPGHTLGTGGHGSPQFSRRL